MTSREVRSGETAFVTGGTGFLGAFLIAHLLRKGCRVVALVRGSEPLRRLLGVLRSIDVEEGPSVDQSHAEGRLVAVEGDVGAPSLGLTATTQGRLAGELDAIWHCAASFQFRPRFRNDIARHNVHGTENVLRFAELCNRRREATLCFVSTAYVCPVVNKVGVEELADSRWPARNLYEWSKREAETLVARYRREERLPAFIARPSVLIGHSVTGDAVGWKGYYAIVRAMYRVRSVMRAARGPGFDGNLSLRVRANPQGRLNLVPVDFVTEALWRLSRVERRDLFVFNVTSGRAVTVAEGFHSLCEALGVTGVKLVGDGNQQKERMTTVDRLFARQASFQLEYLADELDFDQTRLRQVVPRAMLDECAVGAETLRRINGRCIEMLERGEPHGAADGPGSVSVGL